MFKNLPSKNLIELSVASKESKLTKDGVLYTFTNKHTGRSAGAKFIVKDAITAHTVDWNSNNSITSLEFKEMKEKFLFYRNSRKIYSQDVWAVKDPRISMPISIYTSRAKHSLFARNMFTPEPEESKRAFVPLWEVYQFPGISPEPMVWISFSEKKILIAGTSYSGEIKKSVFTVLNFIFPSHNDLPMHCSVNIDKDKKNPTIFFGLSGTGKTTLSSDTNRVLIGDDEHAWTQNGLTNFEGGCYAKTVNLTKEDEPQIYSACKTEGTILENVYIKNGVPDFFNTSITENGRASYPLSSIKGFHKDGFIDAHPKNIIMLTCDAFGVLPPVMKLSPEEAIEQFVLGYTAKVAGTEKGIASPEATFSPCFGAPFMPLHPKQYGRILKEKIEKHSVSCWLVNTGWTAGPYGTGKRIPISVTRKIIDAIHDSSLEASSVFKHKYTGFTVPLVSKDIIPSNILHPESGWQDIKEYEKKVKELIKQFSEKLKNV